MMFNSLEQVQENEHVSIGHCNTVAGHGECGAELRL